MNLFKMSPRIHFLGYFAGKQRGMSCFNCGPSSFLSSAFFTTLKESSTKSPRFYMWNTLISFLVTSTWFSILCILITLQVGLVHQEPNFSCQENEIKCQRAVPIFSCYNNSSMDGCGGGVLPYCGRKCLQDEHPHGVLLQVKLPMTQWDILAIIGS